MIIRHLSDDEPFVVGPRRACYLLDVGATTLYDLIARGELESYREGISRKITMRSIVARIERKLSSELNNSDPSPTAKAVSARMRRRAATEPVSAASPK
jgi:hypothetical protein